MILGLALAWEGDVELVAGGDWGRFVGVEQPIFLVWGGIGEGGLGDDLGVTAGILDGDHFDGDGVSGGGVGDGAVFGAEPFFG